MKRAAAFVLGLALACAPRPPSQPWHASDDETRLTVAVDPREETLAILERLARGLTPAATPYERDVDAWFAPYASHPAVTWTRRLQVNGDGLRTLFPYVGSDFHPRAALQPPPRPGNPDATTHAQPSRKRKSNAWMNPPSPCQ